ncbi:MAG: hypothetical protein ACYCY0_04460 [Acidithiobacillus ferrivorans]
MTEFTALGTLATAFAAAFTALMAYFTKQSTKESSKQTEKIIRYENVPVLQIEQDWSGLGYSRDQAIGFISEKGEGTLSPTDYVNTYMRGDYEINLPIKNIGKGPAINCKIIVTFQCDSITADGSLMALGVGESTLHKQKRIYATVSQPNPANYSSSLCGQWVITLQYSDIFGNIYYTDHHKDPNKEWGIFRENGPRNNPRCKAIMFLSWFVKIRKTCGL